MMMPGMPPGGAGAPAEPADNGKLVNLDAKIDKSECYARNVSARYPMTNLFIGDDTLGCQSDADEQLIIHISFTEFVKVHSLKFSEFANPIDPKHNPSIVKVFVNKNNIGFEDVDDYEPTTTLELTSEDLKANADPIQLKYVLFQRVKSLTFYFEDNNGAEITALGGLKIMGRPVATTNMNDFKKQG